MTDTLVLSARFSRGWKTHFLELPPGLNQNADDEAMVNAALAAGLYPKLLVVDLSNGGLKTLINNQAISIVSACDPDEKLLI